MGTGPRPEGKGCSQVAQPWADRIPIHVHTQKPPAWHPRRRPFLGACHTGLVSSFQFHPELSELVLALVTRLAGVPEGACPRAEVWQHRGMGPFPGSASVLLWPGSPWGQGEAGAQVCLIGTWPQQVRRPPKALSWPQGSLVLNADCSRSCCRKFVVTKGNIAQMYHAPGRKREFNAFVLDKTYFGPYDETTCIDWTDDSR